MFDNIGKKIKGFAKLVCWIGIIASCIVGLVLLIVGANMYAGEMFILMGLCVAAIGSLLSWLGSFMTYGFGELIDKTAGIYMLMGGKEDEKTVPQQTSLDETSNVVRKSVDSWICPNCGRKYEFWVKKCVQCGTDRPEL